MAAILASPLAAQISTTTEPDPFPNTSPFAVDRHCDVERDTPKRTPSVLLSVHDVEGDPLTVGAFTQPAHGTAVANDDGTFVYKPAAGFVGTDEFLFKLSDGRGGVASARMRLRVLPPAPGYAATRFVGLQGLTAGGARIDFGNVAIMPRALDWDRDGDVDLVAGVQGAVWWYRNTGTPTAPVFAAGQRVRAANQQIQAGTGRVTVAVVDMDGDGQRDLVVGHGGTRKLTWYRTTNSTGDVVLAAGVVCRAAAGGDFIAADVRIDVADWNGDGRPDVFTGAGSGHVQIAYGLPGGGAPVFAAPVTVLDGAGLQIEGSYNASPRAVDISRDGVPDLFVAWNWGNIDYRVNRGSAASPMLSANAQLAISLPDGSAPDLHALTDGAFVDLVDLDGDSVLDLVFGGNVGGRIRWARGESAASYLPAIAAVVAAHPQDLGAFLEGNATEKSLLQQRLGALYDFVTALGTPSQVAAVAQGLEQLIVAHPRYFRAASVDRTANPKIPSLAAMVHLILLRCGYHDPAHRARLVQITQMNGGYRKLCEDIGVLLLDNYLNPQGAEAIWQWVRMIPRDLYPGEGITQHESLGGRDYLVRGHLKNIFAGSATGGGEYGFGTDARTVIGGRGSENWFMTVVHHEAAHDFDAYVRQRLPAPWARRWGQLLVAAGGHDAAGVPYLQADPATGWYSEALTQADWRQRGFWDGVAPWATTLRDFYDRGAGAGWKHFGFMRGDIVFFLGAPQESLATQGNQFWNSSEGRIEVALDRWQRGYRSNLTEVLFYIDLLSKGADKVRFCENDDANNLVVRYARLTRDAKGFIGGIQVGSRSWQFTNDANGVVVAVR
ncbi:MAG: VCBS repeat-containing protein [Planctomycetes bacterium]|nr:VCBS repeat-containing protein [Planctomycetota bacterium]